MASCNDLHCLGWGTGSRCCFKAYSIWGQFIRQQKLTGKEKYSVTRAFLGSLQAHSPVRLLTDCWPAHGCHLEPNPSHAASCHATLRNQACPHSGRSSLKETIVPRVCHSLRVSSLASWTRQSGPQHTWDIELPSVFYIPCT